MLKKTFLSLLAFPLAVLGQSINYSQYVNPLIGTGGHGHTFPGATTPFGMVQLSPDTRVDGSWDGCSGYHYNDSIIYGFSHTHLSGTGCSDYGDILLMATPEPTTNPNKYRSSFLHSNEQTKAGYYSVLLNNGNIKAELTATPRVGFHRYAADKPFYMVLDLKHRDELLKGEIEIVNDSTLQGYRISKAWAREQRVYFYICFSRKMRVSIRSRKEICLRYREKQPLLVKVGISAVSIEGARKNLETELPHWDFDRVCKESAQVWDKELSKIEVKGGTDEQKTVFYTALYHTMLAPNLYTDVDGQYLGRDLQVHKANGYNQYTVFSLWDTFRAAHPLYTLIEQQRTTDFIRTFLAQYEQGGRLPVWELAANETECMIGYHAVSVIADAMIKGIKGFDYEKAYEACKHSALLDHFGLSAYKKNGYIGVENESESVSKTLEYAYDDWCIAQMALLLNKPNDYHLFIRRAQSYKNLFDPNTGFMRPRKNGGWLTPFDPKEVNNNFTEGNSWQYSFCVPQDIDGLIRLHEGADKMEAKLDSLFTTDTHTTGREQADITGLIGQYAHGNEPSHHMAYLYNYVGKPYKTQEKVRYILDNFYKNSPDGLIGNEDCGQMSAWYVLSALGLYQVTPGSAEFTIGTPLFPEATIHFENSKQFTIKAPKVSATNMYVEKLVLNGNTLSQPFISNTAVMNQGTLVMKMSNQPNKNALIDRKTTALPQLYLAPSPSFPDSLYTFRPSHTGIGFNPQVIPAPLITASRQVFTDSLLVSIKPLDTAATTYYLLNEANMVKYKAPFYIHNNTAITAVAANDYRFNIAHTEAHFYKKPNSWKVQLNSTYNPQYTAGGDESIIDGLRGATNWRKGGWQGYQGQDFEAVIDLGYEQDIHQLGAGFLQDTQAWILMPTSVDFELSKEGKTFTKALSINNAVADTSFTVQMKDFEGTIHPAKARYVKVRAKNYGNLPKWHPGAGYPAFIFADELWVK